MIDSSVSLTDSRKSVQHNNFKCHYSATRYDDFPRIGFQATVASFISSRQSASATSIHIRVIFVGVVEILVSVRDSTTTLIHISGSLIPILVKGELQFCFL